MSTQTTLTLPTLPQDSLRALERAVAGRFNWRIMTGGAEDQPRFVIEKQVRYDLIRGWPMHALYQISGSFQKTQSGETVLRYTVSGQPGVPIFHATFFIGGLLLITLLLASFVFSPSIGGSGIGALLVGVLFGAMILYGWFAYRGYQGHLREMHRFMETFAQHPAPIAAPLPPPL